MRLPQLLLGSAIGVYRLPIVGEIVSQGKERIVVSLETIGKRRVLKIAPFGFVFPTGDFVPVFKQVSITLPSGEVETQSSDIAVEYFDEKSPKWDVNNLEVMSLVDEAIQPNYVWLKISGRKKTARYVGKDDPTTNKFVYPDGGVTVGVQIPKMLCFRPTRGRVVRIDFNMLYGIVSTSGGDLTRGERFVSITDYDAGIISYLPHIGR